MTQHSQRDAKLKIKLIARNLRDSVLHRGDWSYKRNGRPDIASY